MFSIKHLKYKLTPKQCLFVYNRKVLPLPKEVLNMFREGRKFSYPQTCFMTSMFGDNATEFASIQCTLSNWPKQSLFSQQLQSTPQTYC